MDNYLLETRSFARRAAIISVVKTKFWRKNQKKVFPQFFVARLFPIIDLLLSLIPLFDVFGGKTFSVGGIRTQDGSNVKCL